MRKEKVEHIDQMCRGVIFHPRARFSSSERHSGERSFILLVCSAGVRLIRRCRLLEDFLGITVESEAGLAALNACELWSRQTVACSRAMMLMRKEDYP